MKNKKVNISLFIITILILLFLTIFLILNNLINYSLVSGVLLIICVILFVMYLNNTKSLKAKYQSDIKKITRAYDSVLAYLNCEIKFDNKETIKLNSFEDLVNCQEEIKKPILYSYNEEAAIFIVIDSNTIYYSTLKINDDVIHPIEQKIIDSINNPKVEEKEIDETILDGIDRTMIIQTKNNKKYKVSPLSREKKVSEDTKSLNLTKNLEIPLLKQD